MVVTFFLLMNEIEDNIVTLPLPLLCITVSQSPSLVVYCILLLLLSVVTTISFNSCTVNQVNRSSSVL